MLSSETWRLNWSTRPVYATATAIFRAVFHMCWVNRYYHYYHCFRRVYATATIDLPRKVPYVLGQGPSLPPRPSRKVPYVLGHHCYYHYYHCFDSRPVYATPQSIVRAEFHLGH